MGSNIYINPNAFAIEYWFEGTYTQNGLEIPFTLHSPDNSTPTITWIDTIPFNYKQIEEEILEKFNND